MKNMHMQNEMYNFDIVIIGGGTAGVSAALAATKQNKKVALIEKNNILSGTMTAGLVTPTMPSDIKTSKIYDEIIAALKNNEQCDFIDSGNAVWFNPEMLALTCEQELVKNNCSIFYNATLVCCDVENEAINTISFEHLGNIFSIKAECFIDCSGDAVLGRMTNLIPIKKGDENKTNQATSFRFEVGNIDITKLRNWCNKLNYTFNDCTSDEFFEFVHVPGQQLCGDLLSIFSKALEDGLLLPEDVRYIQGFAIPSKPKTLSFNGPQIPNVYDFTNPYDYSKIIIRGREMQFRLIKFLKNNIPGFENAYISKQATMLGIRESYRIQGQYVLSEEDYLKRAKFEDAVARGDWYIDVHSDDLGVENDTFKAKYDKGEYYEIPLRALVTNEINNYIIAGRCISTTFKMQSSTRIQTTCRDTGAAAGLAAAYAIDNNQKLNNLEGFKINE